MFYGKSMVKYKNMAELNPQFPLGLVVIINEPF
jgi:hypothetical protein